MGVEEETGAGRKTGAAAGGMMEPRCRNWFGSNEGALLLEKRRKENEERSKGTKRA